MEAKKVMTMKVRWKFTGSIYIPSQSVYETVSYIIHLTFITGMEFKKIMVMKVRLKFNGSIYISSLKSSIAVNF